MKKTPNNAKYRFALLLSVISKRATIKRQYGRNKNSAVIDGSSRLDTPCFVVVRLYMTLNLKNTYVMLWCFHEKVLLRRTSVAHPRAEQWAATAFVKINLIPSPPVVWWQKASFKAGQQFTTDKHELRSGPNNMCLKRRMLLVHFEKQFVSFGWCSSDSGKK